MFGWFFKYKKMAKNIIREYGELTFETYSKYLNKTK